MDDSIKNHLFQIQMQKFLFFFGLREDTRTILETIVSFFSYRDDKLKLWHNSCCNFGIVNIIVLRGSVSHVKGCQGSF